MERGGEPRHVLDRALSLDGKVSPRDVLERCETHLHAAGIVDGPYLRYLSPGNREGGFELRQRFQSVVKSAVDVRNIYVDGPVCPPDIPLITRSTGPSNTREELIRSYLNACIDLPERGIDCPRVAQVFCEL